MPAASMPRRLQAGQRQQRGVDLAGRELAQPGVDVAAEVDHPQVGAPRQQLRLAAQRGGADHGASRQLGDGRAAGRAISTSRGSSRASTAPMHQAVGQPGRQVLDRMHREVDPARQQRRLDLLAEQALAAELGERPVGDPIAGRADRHDLERARRGELGMRAARAPGRPARSAPARAASRACRCAAAAGSWRRSWSRGAAQRLSPAIMARNLARIAPPVVLGIETSCDETGGRAGRRRAPGAGRGAAQPARARTRRTAAWCRRSRRARTSRSSTG